ncbi:hypothetical protein MIPYR_10655 [uncultured Microbacterium sp.]|uniref:Uncharacterized protein n=1 Tax=uncultured Microbacterium sp. TaxID=191216 RepID=A0A1Y5NWQ4_9MICO|nr:hypothetical protein MIPYR_10655 [uncultured Microbacterium sp.]
MSATREALPAGAPLVARQLWALLEVLPEHLRDRPTSREARQALGAVVERTPYMVMLSRTEMHTAMAYFRQRGLI